jgi:hypothetical protein
MIHIALPSKLKTRARSLCETDDFSMKRVGFWALVFAEAFFVGALLGRVFSLM